MRHKALCLLLVPFLLATACSRLTFVRPKGKMGPLSGEQVAQDYSVKDSPEVKRRQDQQLMLARSVQHLQAGDLVAAEKDALAVLKLDAGSADAETLLAARNRPAAGTAALPSWRPGRARRRTTTVPGYARTAMPPRRWSGSTGPWPHRATHRPRRRWPTPAVAR